MKRRSFLKLICASPLAGLVKAGEIGPIWSLNVDMALDLMSITPMKRALRFIGFLKTK